MPHPTLGGILQPARLIGRQRSGNRLGRPTLLDLDEGEAAATHGDQIDLAEWTTLAAGENAIALEHQRARCKPLGEAPPALGSTSPPADIPCAGGS